MMDPVSEDLYCLFDVLAGYKFEFAYFGIGRLMLLVLKALMQAGRFYLNKF